MAKPKANTQWAPGTRLSRMNREDGQWEYEMELIKNKKHVEERSPKEQPFFCGEIVMNYKGEIIKIDEVDTNGYYVKYGGVKVGVECFKKLPDWFKEAYGKVMFELEMSWN